MGCWYIRQIDRAWDAIGSVSGNVATLGKCHGIHGSLWWRGKGGVNLGICLMYQWPNLILHHDSHSELSHIFVINLLFQIGTSFSSLMSLLMWTSERFVSSFVIKTYLIEAPNFLKSSFFLITFQIYKTVLNMTLIPRSMIFPCQAKSKII